MSYNSGGGGGASLASQMQKVIDQIMNDQLNEAKFSAMLSAAGQAGVAAANPRTPVRTGRLQRGNQAEVSGLTLHFHNDVEYAGIVNYGTSTRPPRLFFDAGVEAIQQNIDESLAQK